jgi:hypothetical protein
VTPLTDAQLREYIAFLYGPDDDDTAPLPVPPNPNCDETWSDLITPTPESE